jgi:hypothetical protein
MKFGADALLGSSSLTFDQNVKFGAEALLGSSHQKQSTQEGSSIQSKVQTGYTVHKTLFTHVVVVVIFHMRT